MYLNRCEIQTERIVVRLVFCVQEEYQVVMDLKLCVTCYADTTNQNGTTYPGTLAHPIVIYCITLFCCIRYTSYITDTK